MNKSLNMLLAGGIFFLLPFFVTRILRMWRLQLEPPKLLAIFLLGCVVFSVHLGRRVHPLLGFMFGVFSFNVYWSGFGSMQMYGLAYLSAAIYVALWFLRGG